MPSSFEKKDVDKISAFFDYFVFSNPTAVSGVALSLALYFVMGFGLPAYAQDFAARGIAEYVIVDPDAIDQFQQGYILKFENEAYALSNTPFDERIIGVVSLAPSVATSSVGRESAIPIVRFGVTNVAVAGSVAAGDFITTSATAGVGQRANKSGHIVGRALTSFEPESFNQIGLVLVDVDPRFAWPEGIRLELGGLLANPGEAFSILPRPVRYAMATTVALIAVVAGYIIYNRTSASTVAAVGRNPLASRTIMVLAGFQSALTFILVAAGFLLAYLILAL